MSTMFISVAVCHNGNHAVFCVSYSAGTSLVKQVKTRKPVWDNGTMENHFRETPVPATSEHLLDCN